MQVHQNISRVPWDGSGLPAQCSSTRLPLALANIHIASSSKSMDAQGSRRNLTSSVVTHYSLTFIILCTMILKLAPRTRQLHSR